MTCFSFERTKTITWQQKTLRCDWSHKFFHVLFFLQACSPGRKHVSSSTKETWRCCQLDSKETNHSETNILTLWVFGVDLNCAVLCDREHTEFEIAPRRYQWGVRTNCFQAFQHVCVQAELYSGHWLPGLICPVFGQTTPNLRSLFSRTSLFRVVNSV